MLRSAPQRGTQLRIHGKAELWVFIVEAHGPLRAPTPGNGSAMRAGGHWYGAVRRGERGSYVFNVVAVSVPAPGDVAPPLCSAKRVCTCPRFNHLGRLRVQTFWYSQCSILYAFSLLPLSLGHMSISLSLLSLFFLSLPLPLILPGGSLSSIEGSIFLPTRRASFFHRGGSRPSIEATLAPPSRRVSFLCRCGRLSFLFLSSAAMPLRCFHLHPNPRRCSVAGRICGTRLSECSRARMSINKSSCVRSRRQAHVVQHYPPR